MAVQSHSVDPDPRSFSPSQSAPRRSWILPKLSVRASTKHGRGVFANSLIRKGERLAIFGGDVMLIDEISTLPEDLQDYPMQIEERFVLGSPKRQCA